MMKQRAARRIFPGVTVVLALLLAGVIPGAAQAPYEVGRVTIETTSVGAIVGASWGHGILRFRGRTYPFRISGLSVGEVGATRASAVGLAYNLRKPSDLAGNYAALAAGVAAGGGVGGVKMQNQKGVVMELHSVQQGLDLTIGAQGFRIEMP